MFWTLVTRKTALYQLSAQPVGMVMTVITTIRASPHIHHCMMKPVTSRFGREFQSDINAFLLWVVLELRPVEGFAELVVELAQSCFLDVGLGWRGFEHPAERGQRSWQWLLPLFARPKA